MLTATTSATATTATLDNTKKNDLGQKDIFLKLLVAQMEHQDPLKPQDATQMSSQLAQFNMVEQQTESNKLLQQLVDSGASGSSAGSSSTLSSGNAAGYLGHTVTANQNLINFDGTSQSFNVAMEADAADSIVFIYDAGGNPVRTMAGSLSAGANPLIWDGLTDSGATAPQGSYLIGVSALDANGSEVASTVQRTGIVEAVRFTPNGTEFIVDRVATTATAITELRI